MMHAVTKTPDTSQPRTEDPSTNLREQVDEVLALMRPAVQSDGGDVELVDVTADGKVTVRLHGACVGCPSASITLKSGIERTLQTHVPGVSSVEAVE